MDKRSPNISPDENYSDPRFSEESSKSGLLYEQSILLSHRGEEQWILPEEESLEGLVLFDGIEAEYGNFEEQENGEAEAEYGNLERDGMGESGYIRRSWISRQLEESGELQEGKNYWHRDSRRSFSHDYCSPGYYMITASITDGSPALSMIPDIDLPELKRGGDDYALADRTWKTYSEGNHGHSPPSSGNQDYEIRVDARSYSCGDGSNRTAEKEAWQ